MVCILRSSVLLILDQIRNEVNQEKGYTKIYTFSLILGK